jgi:hypothetical protein
VASFRGQGLTLGRGHSACLMKQSVAQTVELMERHWGEELMTYLTMLSRDIYELQFSSLMLVLFTIWYFVRYF